MKKIISMAGAAFVAALAMSAPAQASVLENFQIKLGVSGVLPNESGSPVDVEISDEWVPSLQVEYFFSDNISAELLCCIATHDVATASGLDLGEVTHFPPTLTVKYRWTDFGQFQPYVGAGVNYTAFIDDEQPPGVDVDYDESVGGALQVGFDYRLDDHWALNLDARRIWISTDATVTLAGAPPTVINNDVDIDPWVVSASVGYRF